MKFVPFWLLMMLPLFATSVRVGTMNVYLGIDTPGDPEYEALKDTLARIDADVVSLQEVRNADTTGNPSNLDQLAGALGYPHVFIPDGTDFDSNNDVVLLSKFPFSNTYSIASPAGARDLTRVHAAAKVDVPGTNDDPMVVGLHLKCCFDPDDFFRRAVEIERIKFFLDDQGLNGSDNVIVMGDFNLLGSDQLYTEQNFQNLTTLPGSYELGNDISFPLLYFQNPVSYFTSYPLLNPMPLQQNGTDDDTFIGGSVLDYILISQALIDRGAVLEVYNSALESNHPGLPKSGRPLPASTSATASDHYPIFGDFELASGLPLELKVTSSILIEGGPAATISVTLPQTPSQPVTVLLSSSDPGEAMPALMTLTFPAGSTFLSTTLIPKTDKIIDGVQNITLLAAATGYLSNETTITVLDSDTTRYELPAIGATVTEDFTGFAGPQSPAKWTASGLDWLGLDNGSSSDVGFRSYGIDGSLGIQSGTETNLAASFRNSTGEIISNLQINYDAEQWHSAFDGSLDQFQVEILTPSGATTVPALTFISQNTLDSGAIPKGTSKKISTVVSGLSIAPNADFQIIFKAVPGTPGTGGTDAIFLNELHYDNSETDTGEFSEVVVGPDFSGDLSEVDLVFYNGSSGNSYASHALSTFTLDTTEASGHRIFSKNIPGIQNGGSDGIAIVENGNVLQFLSYEGTLTATSGPASGMTSTDIGASQSLPQPAGQASIGLTGSGAAPGDFTWTRFSGPFTKGALNEGQSFGISAKNQGIAIDNLQVTPLANIFLPVVTIHDDSTLTFPSLSGVSYQIETSTDLETWSLFQTAIGTGEEISIDIRSGDEKRFFRVRLN
ncbi:MAG: endonuclease/exonuclease/phosphatase family protein [Akkermansiaceae bacterium]